jgi:hypothetical protein
LDVPDDGYSRNVPDDGYSRNVPDDGYSRNVPDDGYSRNVPDDGYSRNAMSALNLISTLSSIIQKLVIECVCCLVIDKEGKTELYEE